MASHCHKGDCSLAITWSSLSCSLSLINFCLADMNLLNHLCLDVLLLERSWRRFLFKLCLSSGCSSCCLVNHRTLISLSRSSTACCSCGLLVLTLTWFLWSHCLCTKWWRDTKTLDIYFLLDFLMLCLV